MDNKSREDSFMQFFEHGTSGFDPYEWQALAAIEGLPDVLPVPTGLGKTEVALAWAWRLLVDKQPEPRHLVYCLPMRSLVTQTVDRLRACFSALKTMSSGIDVAVYQLMGGSIEEDWAAQPDKPWVLVGTQDQLLSRALNRGYSMSRFDWPVHFGLLNNDCRWLIDEVQLMGPGLWTTAQLDWMRRKRFPSLKPCLTTWMSATAGPSFLKTTDREREGLSESSQDQMAFESKLNAALDRDEKLQWWREAKRPLAWWTAEASEANTAAGKKRKATKKSETATPEAIAASVIAKHVAGKLSLVICNTVKTAHEVFRALSAIDHKALLTSRFRREDRARHEQRLIDFDSRRKEGTLPQDDPGLVCVSTQVIEAGMDISAHRLFTELAPWPSMLQRLGRLNRKGDDQEAAAWVWETPTGGGNKKGDRIGPYERTDIELSKKLVNAFVPLSQEKPFSKARTELDANQEKNVTEALRHKPAPMPRALDVHGLFSTERDVHGGFTDISAFVRGTDPDVDVTVFWRDWSGNSPPHGDELDGPVINPAKEGCPVSCYGDRGVQEMLKQSKTKAWLWDEEAGRWERVNHWDIRPGMLVMLKRDVGGYDETEGWTGDPSNMLSAVPSAGRGAILEEDAWTEAGYWSMLQDHLKDARTAAEGLCDTLDLTGDVRNAVIKAAGLHDIGKSHPQWQQALPGWNGLAGLPTGLFAKTPRILAVDASKTCDLSRIRDEIRNLSPTAISLPDGRSWRGQEIVRLRWFVDEKPSAKDCGALTDLDGVCWVGEPAFRPNLRHEVASALAMWWAYRNSDTKPFPALAVYLTASHHGKARTVLRSTTGKGDDVFGVTKEPSELIIDGAQWPLDLSIAKDGAEGRWEGEVFVLTGYGWTGLVADLLGPWRPEEKSNVGAVPEDEPRQLGPFALAYLEALVRIADWRASANPSVSIKPSEVVNV